MKGEKWKAALTVAERFAGNDVLYCISFGHGLMKVGTTSSIRDRIRQYDTHGLLNSLFDWMVVVKVCPNNFSAEKYAISLFSERLQKRGRELFDSPSISMAKKVIHYCAANAQQNAQSDTLVRAFARMGGKADVAKRFGYKSTTVNSWACRGKVPPYILADDEKLARALSRAGYKRGGE